MENNWKEKLRREWFCDDEQGGWTIANPDIERFIETEVIEKLIEEIPPHEGEEVSINYLKQQLRAKWLK